MTHEKSIGSILRHKNSLRERERECVCVREREIVSIEAAIDQQFEKANYSIYFNYSINDSGRAQTAWGVCEARNIFFVSCELRPTTSNAVKNINLLKQSKTIREGKREIKLLKIYIHIRTYVLYIYIYIYIYCYTSLIQS